MPDERSFETAEGVRRHALVLGVDGVRYDTVRRARTPHLDAIAAAGFLAPVQVDRSGPTISGPAWATVATGVLPPRHGIFDNDLDGHRIREHPDFLTRIRLARPGARTYAAAGWPPLLSQASGGPVFLGGGYVPLRDPDHDLGAWENAEELITADAVKVLAREDVAAAFVYFGGPDIVAHELGAGPKYLRCVEDTDVRIGRILDAIRTRPRHAEEAWTTIVVTDHGHLDGGGHGGDSPAERTAWIAAAGPTVPTDPPAWLAQADIHPHVLVALGIALDPGWELAGRPFDAEPGQH